MTDVQRLIPALMPRDGRGHQFVLYADSCSGREGRPAEERLSRVNAVVRRLDPPPEFISFPGDAVSDGGDVSQWERWTGLEMAWPREAGIPIYQATSNHNTYDEESVRLYRRFWSELPENGPESLRGLAYSFRRGSLLYVCLHQPNSHRSPGMTVEVDRVQMDWLEQVLAANTDADHILVAGHYPVFSVNGYQTRSWCFRPEPARVLWEILVRHRVSAYLCSHIIAFDVQAHQGVLQITSGGAGTPAGPGGFMPGSTEYLHAVQLAIDADGLRYQVLDPEGEVREQLAWPLPEPERWSPATAVSLPAPEKVLYLRVAGQAADGLQPEPFRPAIAWLRAADESFFFGVDSLSGRFVLDLDLGEAGTQRWVGPEADLECPPSIELALHPGMGPGGVLYRLQPEAPWTSMSTQSAAGLESVIRPTSPITVSSPSLALSTATAPLGRP